MQTGNSGIQGKRIFRYAVFFIMVLLCGCRHSGPVYREGSIETVKQSAGIVQEDTPAEPQTAAQTGDEDDVPEKTTVTVFVCGAVNSPGVYDLEAPARANAAVLAAGGFREDADREWCNLAQILSDGQKLRIHTLSETKLLESEGFAEEGREGSGMNAGSEAAAGISGTAGHEDGRINLNTATKEELKTLPGIGDARAEAILSWRRQHGMFTDIAQIKEISGFKDAIYNNIRELITVGQ